MNQAKDSNSLAPTIWTASIVAALVIAGTLWLSSHVKAGLDGFQEALAPYTQALTAEAAEQDLTEAACTEKDPARYRINAVNEPAPKQTGPLGMGLEQELAVQGHWLSDSGAWLPIDRYGRVVTDEPGLTKAPSGGHTPACG